MLEPLTPLPWKPKQKGEIGSTSLTFYEDMDYAVYAANLLPKIIDELEYLAENEDEASMAYQTIAGILKLVETYRP